MNKIIWCVVFFTILLYQGCATVKKNDYIDIQTLSAVSDSKVKIRSVEVVIDYVQQADIAEQIKKMSHVLLCNTDMAQGDSNIYMDMQILQRSFLQSVEEKKSITISLFLFDENEMLCAQLNTYIVSSETFISSVTQYSYISAMIEKILQEKNSLQKKMEYKE